MKAHLTTRIEHTIKFYTQEKFANMDVFGLSDLFTFNYAKEFIEIRLAFSDLGNQTRLTNIVPTVLSEWDLKDLNEIIEDRTILTPMKLYTVLIYLVNKEIMPPGDYIIDFNK